MRKTTELFMGLRSLFRLYDKMLKKVCTEHDLTLVEADIISFLHNNPGKDTAADIVELRMLSKGAVSKSVESLIQKSLLERTPDLEDRRVPVIDTEKEIRGTRDEFLRLGAREFTQKVYRSKKLYVTDTTMRWQ